MLRVYCEVFNFTKNFCVLGLDVNSCSKLSSPKSAFSKGNKKNLKVRGLENRPG